MRAKKEHKQHVLSQSVIMMQAVRINCKQDSCIAIICLEWTETMIYLGA